MQVNSVHVNEVQVNEVHVNEVSNDMSQQPSPGQQPPPPTPKPSQPPTTPARPRVRDGLTIMGAGVLVFIGLCVMCVFTFATSQDQTRVIDGRREVELADGNWSLFVDYDRQDLQVVVSDSGGRDVPVDDFVHPADDGTLVVDSGRDWTPAGSVRIPSEGDYIIDAGDGSAWLKKTDSLAFLTAVAQLVAAMVIGGGVFVWGAVALLMGLLARSTGPRTATAASP